LFRESILHYNVVSIDGFSLWKETTRMSRSPLDRLAQTLQHHGLVRFLDHFDREFPDIHLKNVLVDELGPHREMGIEGRTVINFGSDSFLGLDQDPRVQEAIREGLRRWGTHNGASRAFSSVRTNDEAEAKLAQWLGTEDTLIYASVSLANLGALPGLVGRKDLLILDEHAHNSMQEGAKIAQANGTRLATFAHSSPADLQKVFDDAGDYRLGVVAVDGIYSMSGALPPLAELNEVCLRNNAILYVDDAHASGVLGPNGRGTVLDALGNYDNALVVGSLSKGFSCYGGFIGCPREFKRLLQIRSSTFIFGGPVPPPYLDAICTVCDILTSREYDALHGRLMSNLRRFTEGVSNLGLVVLGGLTPIVSILVGDEETTLRAGHFLFEEGFYVQSVLFPAVAFHAGVLRIQVNANHLPEQIDALIDAFDRLKNHLPLPESRHQATTMRLAG
jgi:7-keto-8-aminopelargonate synthetase-like enzyme